MNLIVVALLILFAAVTRVIPHAPNFTPIIAITIFAGAYLKRSQSILIPIVALFVSDLIIGFYGPLMFFVYGSLVAVALFNLDPSKKVSVGSVLGSSFAGSALFYVITNFGVWLLSDVYPKTFAGLGLCYAMALPFAWYTFGSTLLYGGTLFGLYALAEKHVPGVVPAT